MSGSNPFRPKNPQSSLPPPTSFPSFPSISTPSAPPPVTTFKSSLARAPPASLPPDLDDAASSDDQSVSDPFHRSSYATDEDAEEELRPYVGVVDRVSAATPGDDDRPQPIRAVPDPAVPSRGPALPAPAAAPGQIGNREHPAPLWQAGPSRENAPVAGSTVSTLSSTPYGGFRTPDSSTTDVSRPPDWRPGLGPRGRPGLSTASDIASRPLASRPGNRDRVPPPPPKSHHGKRIAPSPGTTPSLTQTTPGRSTSRFSFHGSPSEPSHSPRPSVSGSDYFTARSESQPAQAPAADTLRRSQSQYKRPPTPPLSRRHSQMRRSKTTLSKVNPVRLSIPAAEEASTSSSSSSSPPPSPGAWSLNPSRTRESRTGDACSEELGDPATSSPRPDSSSPLSPTESSTAMPGPSTKRSSLYNALPPLPPPRRSRGSSNQSNDSSGLSLRPGKPADPVPAAAATTTSSTTTKDQFVPHPSNASDILADLSRLQKEVDDLRGHYEGRKASQ
ncbi:hypothetical protein BO70DRAFT_382924 [Aspergillus heteromorphus CBS 117.55]|uniref:Uncharacterized protein n=1 Tax=Aspergillus heteromorphus CBS 117.55 TaxID=1448321 RepID=A0A317UZQ6_9EURO|nr:uncharacterized protein BO70DRAFT_382924 [Aspergillus heteromorphus CBS 117.55]PWY67534.1 hypothetical protein BO70DRAFT_382924 [Aspergillus heteromorphus CBS 117.55]